MKIVNRLYSIEGRWSLHLTVDGQRYMNLFGININWLLGISLIVLFIGCAENKTTISTEETANPEVMATPIRYLALGDSYTIGESVPAENNYPNLIVSALQAAEMKAEDAQIIAKTGWTTDELNVAIQEAAPDTTFHIVSLLIGVNNQFRGRNVEEYAPEFEDLLQQAIRFANGDRSKVFVVSIPDYAYTPFGQQSKPELISKGIDEYNAVNRSITERYQIAYFDITPISREGIEDPTLVATDKLHPSGAQYERWVELILEDIKKIIAL